MNGFITTQALTKNISEQIIILFTLKKYKRRGKLGLLKHPMQIPQLQKVTNGISGADKDYIVQISGKDLILSSVPVTLSLVCTI